MARTLEDIRASRPTIDRAKVEATTESGIRRQMIEDGHHDPDATMTFTTVKRRSGERGQGRKAPKVPVSLRIEPDVLAAFKSTGEGWQGRIGEVLREAAKSLKS